MRIVMKHEKARVEDAFPYDRYVVEHVLSLLEACRCVDVSSELGSDALKPLEKALSREVFRSVEAHMLEEVSEAVLVIVLLECSDVSCKVELSPLCRLVVVADVISHTVFELACSYGRIVRKRCLTECHCCSEDCCNENK